MISISTSQTFRSWVVIFHLRQPMEFLSLNLYDTPGLAPRMNVLYWGPGDFPVSYSNRDTSRNAWNRHSGSFYGRYGDLIQQYEVSLSRMLNEILILDQQWLPTNQTFHQFHDLDTELDLHRLWVVFHGAFATGVAYQQGTLTLPDTWFRPPILGLANAPIVETKFPELAMSLLDFSPRIPLGTFSIFALPFSLITQHIFYWAHIFLCTISYFVCCFLA